MKKISVSSGFQVGNGEDSTSRKSSSVIHHPIDWSKHKRSSYLRGYGSNNNSDNNSNDDNNDNNDETIGRGIVREDVMKEELEDIRENLIMNLEKRPALVRQNIVMDSAIGEDEDDEDDDGRDEVGGRGNCAQREAPSKSQPHNRGMKIEDVKKRRKKKCKSKDTNSGVFTSLKSMAKADEEKSEKNHHYRPMKMLSENNNSNNNKSNNNDGQNKSPGMLKKMKNQHAANQENERRRRQIIQEKDDKYTLTNLPFAQYTRNQANCQKQSDVKNKQQRAFPFGGADENRNDSNNSRGNKGKSIEAGLGSFIGAGGFGGCNKQGVKQPVKRRVPPRQKKR